MGEILKQIVELARDLERPGLGTSLTRAHTGRVSDSFTQEEQICEILVSAWLDGSDDDPMHWGRQLLRELLEELPRCSVSATFRARDFPETVCPTDPMMFGPPPTPGPNRYNRTGQTALYLGESLAAVSAEMRE